MEEKAYQDLVPVLGHIWLKRAQPIGYIDGYQEINVCAEMDGVMCAVGRIRQARDGAFYDGEKPIGRLGEESFTKYIENLAGPQGLGEDELFDHVCEVYKKDQSLAAVTKSTGVSKERARRILITRGLLTNDLISKIAWLYDGGKGKSVSEIADILGVSENVVQKNMAYT